MDNDQLRFRIRLRLLQLGRSPIDAATAVGLEPDFLSDFLSGKKPSLSKAWAPMVATALDWTVAELMADTPVDARPAHLSKYTENDATAHRWRDLVGLVGFLFSIAIQSNIDRHRGADGPREADGPRDRTRNGHGHFRNRRRHSAVSRQQGWREKKIDAASNFYCSADRIPCAGTAIVPRRGSERYHIIWAMGHLPAAVPGAL